MGAINNCVVYLFFIVIIILKFNTTSITGEVKVIDFVQKLDHFAQYDELRNFTFQQRLLIDDTRWGGAAAKAPIFVLFGNQLAATLDPEQYGILNLSATSFQAMIIHIEHRFYGDSIPLGNISLAMANNQIRACLTTDQALEDYVNIIQSLKANLSAYYSPVIVMGHGYGGALATWFRLKFNELTIGALASSTPMYYYGNSTPGDGYCSIISNDFEDVSEKCYQSIRKSWKLIDDTPLSQLSHIFNTCRPLQSHNELKNWLGQMYAHAAIYDIPGDKLKKDICIFVAGGTLETLSRTLYSRYMDVNCFDTHSVNVPSPYEMVSNTTIAWEWQRCAELIFPIGCNQPTMLPSMPFDLAQFQEYCRVRFGDIPVPNSPISVFRSMDMVHSLAGFGGNIIFSNGLRDPLSSGGILNDLSETIVALTTTEGTCCMEFVATSDDDPKWLRKQRAKELKIFQTWIDHYHHKNMASDPISQTSVLYLCIELIVLLHLHHWII